MPHKLIEIPTIKLSRDRKVSPKSKWEKGKKRWVPVIPNAFGIPAILSCPERTEWCENICYADDIPWPNVRKLLEHNYSLLQECGSNVSAMVGLLYEAVSNINWKDEIKIFRWMYSGDIFNRPFAAAVAEVCKMTPDIQHWIYSRTLSAVDLLEGVPNLTVYWSVDRDNMERAKAMMGPETLFAFSGDSWEETEELSRSLIGRNSPKCPELTSRYDLVSEDGVGACAECLLCVRGINHVQFSSGKDRKTYVKTKTGS